MKYKIKKIFPQFFLVSHLLFSAISMGNIHGMQSSPQVNIRGIINFNADVCMEYYKSEADKGDLSHQVNLAAIYYTCHDAGETLCVERNLDEAEKYFKLASLQGHKPSSIFLHAIENEKNSLINSFLNEKVRYVIPFALEGNTIAQYELGYFYYTGDGVTQDYKVAEKWFSFVVDQKSGSTPLDDKSAINKAHLLLAKLYHQGMGVVADSNKAAQHLEIPALDLYFISQFSVFYEDFLKLGCLDDNFVLYANYMALFLGVKKILPKTEMSNAKQIQDGVSCEFSAFVNNVPLDKLIKLFSFIGNNKHKTQIGLYFTDLGRNHISYDSNAQFDTDCCLMLLNMGKFFGNKEANDLLNKIRKNKTYRECKPEKFSMLKETLAIAEGKSTLKQSNNTSKIEGNVSSISKTMTSSSTVLEAKKLSDLAILYFEGSGVTKDEIKGLEMMHRAAELGSVTAHAFLGTVYLIGKGVNRDYTLALKHLKAASDGGDARSQRSLGLMYRNGMGVKKDLARAMELFVQAVNGGDEMAHKYLAEIQQNSVTIKIPRENVDNNPNGVTVQIPNAKGTNPGTQSPNYIQIQSSKAGLNFTANSNQNTSNNKQTSPTLQSSKKAESKKELKNIKRSVRPTSGFGSSKSPLSSAKNTSSANEVKESIILKQASPFLNRKNDALLTTSTTSTSSPIISTVPVKEEMPMEMKDSSIICEDKKEKKRGIIRIPKPVQAMIEHTKRAQEKKEKKELEKQEKKSKKSVRFGLEKTATEESSFVSSSCADSNSKSHWSLSMSESLMSESFHEAENPNLTLDQQTKCDLMKDVYPKLYRLIQKSDMKHISQLRFKNSNLIKETLSLMNEFKIIEMTKFKSSKNGPKINANWVGNEKIKFSVHTTHGSSAYEKWYHNPDVVVSFFEFIAKCDPVISDFLKIHFGEFCFSRDLTISAKINNNSPSRNDNHGNESRPD